MPAPDYAVEIAQLEAGLASGEATVESDGDRVTYRTIAEIQKGIAYFTRKAATAPSGRQTMGTTLASFQGG